MSDYYERLGVARDASPEQIKKAFRERALEFHPDRNPGNPRAEENFKKINEAYSTLGDPEKKTRYDALGYSDDNFAQRRRPAENPYGESPFGESPFGDAGYGRYTWTFRTGGGQRESGYSRREAVEMLLRNVFSVVMGVALFRISAIFGIFGVLICITAIGRGLLNSLRAIMLLAKSRD